MRPPDYFRPSESPARSLNWKMAAIGVGVLFTTLALVAWLLGAFSNR